MDKNHKTVTEESPESNPTAQGNPDEMTHEELVAYYEQEYIRESLASNAPKNPEAAAESSDFPAWAGVLAHVIVFVIAGLGAFFWLGSLGFGLIATIIVSVIVAVAATGCARLLANANWSISIF